MQATTNGFNKTGISTSEENVQKMLEANTRWAPTEGPDISLSDKDRQIYILEAENIGSIPPPSTIQGILKSGINKIMGERPEMLMDKIGERIAFERSGTRLYEALIRKFEVLQETGSVPDLPLPMNVSAEGPLGTLLRIRDEEHEHFLMLSEVMQALGGDPTAQTPCANVIATASLGLLQVLTDPRTTFGQCLTAILTAELTDNAGWELLISLADQSGENEIADRFRAALVDEEQHLVTVRAWVTALTVASVVTPAT